MTFEFTRKPFMHLDLHRVSPSAEDAPETRVYVLLPSLEELLGEPGFGQRDAIFLPGCRRPLDGWAIFGSVRERGLPLH